MTEEITIDGEVLAYLRAIGQDTGLRDRLRRAPKSMVLADAIAQGYRFDEATFDATIWQTEIAIAERLGEPFDFGCSMWETMWGKHYLDYLIENVAEVVS